MGSSFTTLNMFTSDQIRRGFILLLLVVGLVSAMRKGGKRKTKFCPKEGRPGTEKNCVANSTHFKCGIFFENLYGDNPTEITWLGALPDNFDQVKDEDRNDVFPKYNGATVKEADFEFSDDNLCQESHANNVCYTIMNGVNDKDLESCERTFGNLRDNSKRIGDQLCSQVKGYRARKKLPIAVDNLMLTFKYSSCKSDWTQVSSTQAGDLKYKDLVCCDENGKYKRCDGQPLGPGC